MALVKKLVEELVKGTVTVKELWMLIDMKSNFLDLCRHADSKKGDDLSKRAESALNLRNEEHEEYKRLRNLVNNFVSMYAGLGIGQCLELEALSQAAKSDVAKLSISHLCKRSVSGRITVTYLRMPDNLKSLLEPLQRFSKSAIFQCLWIEEGEEMKKQKQLIQSSQSVALNEIITGLCEVVLLRWRDICKTVYEGSMRLREVSRIFGDFFDDRDGLQEELQMIQSFDVSYEKRSWTKERFTQIEQYGKFGRRVNAAKTLKQVCSTLELTQPILEIDIISNQVTAKL